MIRRWALGPCALVLLAVPGFAAGPPSAPADAAAVAARISRYLEADWAARGVVPARPADDSEFVRRVYLDLAGRIPSVTEVRDFLADRRPDKRARLIDRLLDSPRYAIHWTNVWRALLLPEVASNLQVRFNAGSFEGWLRTELRNNVTYDVMVRDLLTAPLAGSAGGKVFFAGGGTASPSVFFQAKDFKPEELASASARLFLGVNVGCAQCHNHPFADWKREQFWSFAAFFAGLQSRLQGDFFVFEREVDDRRELAIPGTEKVAQAKFLDGTAPSWKFRTSSRHTLAEWMTRADNPYFARAAANRMWAYFLGTGLSDPVDEMVGAERSPSHPEVLDELAREFAAHRFDLKLLIRAITLSKAYQLSSARSHPSQDDPRHFARMPLRGLSAEQLFDSVSQATGYQEAGNNGRAIFFGGPDSPRAEFLSRFGGTERPVDVQTSILQALALMNGKVTASATTLASSETLAAVADAPFLDTPAKVEALYLAALSRKPREKELARLVRYVESGGAAGTAGSEERQKRESDALADVFWALLNSSEFFLNH